nr:MAG TPA: hypothetical protein [Caudoviricetes sp.]
MERLARCRSITMFLTGQCVRCFPKVGFMRKCLPTLPYAHL